MAGDRKDFVNIRLTEDAAKLSGGRLLFANASMHYEFLDRAPVEVLVSQWRRVLSAETLGAVALFEVADDPQPAVSEPISKETV